jgi:hypothetical protein
MRLGFVLGLTMYHTFHVGCLTFACLTSSEHTLFLDPAYLIMRLQEWPVHRFQRLMAQRKHKAQQAQHGAAYPQPPLHPTATRQPTQANGHFAAPLANHQNNALPSVRRAVSRDGSMLASDPAADCSRPLQLPNGAGLASTAARRTRAQQPAASNEALTADGHGRSNGVWPWQHAATADAAGRDIDRGSRQRHSGNAWPWDRCSGGQQGSSDQAWPLQGVRAGSGGRKQEQQGGAPGRTGTVGGPQQGSAGSAWGPWLDESNPSRPVTAAGQQQGNAGGAWGAWLDDGKPVGESAGAGDMPPAAECAANPWAVTAGAAPQQPHESQLVLGL